MEDQEISRMIQELTLRFHAINTDLLMEFLRFKGYVSIEHTGQDTVYSFQDVPIFKTWIEVNENGGKVRYEKYF